MILRSRNRPISMRLWRGVELESAGNGQIHNSGGELRGIPLQRCLPPNGLLTNTLHFCLFGRTFRYRAIGRIRNSV